MPKTAAIIFGVGPREGVGGELCCRAAREGFHVFVNGRSPEKLAAIVASIVAEGGSAEPLLADVTLESEIIAAMDKVASSGIRWNCHLQCWQQPTRTLSRCVARRV